MVEKLFVKDPDAVLDYAFDWNNVAEGTWLQTGETISAYVVTAEAGLTKDSDSESDGLITVWLSGGSAGEQYVVACRITTSLGRTDERSIWIVVRER